MRLELRASDGDTCTKCGSYHLLYLPDTNEALIEDITSLMAGQGEELERDALDRVQELRGQVFDDVEERLSRFEADVKELFRVELASLADALDSSLGTTSRLRPLKRRWREAASRAIFEKTHEMLAQTHRL